ncbi:PHP domain-containing protein [Clostridium sp. D2Q-14]|uniref:PHP domain-containing protein n=1 Tax=Anaeromonas gelatinilytica TaxID=2683194 RepID=UPI00193BE5F2|nr:PHP domain-containing protein [Anaeromonas gelatinilytica]MBS4535982.1 PHP domain-containing protein [Anaeromonas gelatinilytica]
MKKADLHIHTTASDGKYSPSDIVNLAIRENLNLIAITDHDTIEGIDEAINKSKIYDDFTVIPGIELSTIYNDNEVHLLGYFIDYKNKDLINLLKKIKEYRYNRAKKIVNKLQNLNINITFNEVLKELKGENIGRPHIARVLVNKGYTENISEAFNEYIGKGKKAFVDRYRLSFKKGIEIIHKCNGIAVLAHPFLLDVNINHLIDNFSVDGIEVYHSKHSKEISNKYLNLAKSKNLYITGGSDFHGDKSEDSPNIGDSYIEFNSLKELLYKFKYK